MKILLLGPQGAGKGTQAQRLARATGARHVATGDLVRAEIKAGTPLGRTIKDYNDRGELVPDDIIVSMVMERMRDADCWILDGFPRTQAQAQALDAALQVAACEIDAAVALEAPDESLVERLSGRRTSEATGVIYHLTGNPPPASDPGPFVQRDDDKPENIQHRLAIYHKETEPLKDYYARQDKLLRVDALQPIDTVTGTILLALEDLGGESEAVPTELPQSHECYAAAS
jgi:adenylate kinase